MDRRTWTARGLLGLAVVAVAVLLVLLLARTDHDYTGDPTVHDKVLVSCASPMAGFGAAEPRDHTVSSPGASGFATACQGQRDQRLGLALLLGLAAVLLVQAAMYVTRRRPQG